MIGQYLSQTNESATVPVLQNFLELNKAQVKIRFRMDFQQSSGPCLVPKKFCRIFQIPRHIEYLDACMEY